MRIWLVVGQESDEHRLTEVRRIDRIRIQPQDPPHDAQRPQGLPRQQRYGPRLTLVSRRRLTKTVADVDLLLMHNTTFAAEYVTHLTCPRVLEDGWIDSS